MLIIDDLLVKWPLRGLVWLGERIEEAVEREMTDESALVDRLLELEVAREEGRIDEETHAARKKEILRNLRRARRDRGEGIHIVDAGEEGPGSGISADIDVHLDDEGSEGDGEGR